MMQLRRIAGMLSLVTLLLLLNVASVLAATTTDWEMRLLRLKVLVLCRRMLIMLCRLG